MDKTSRERLFPYFFFALFIFMLYEGGRLLEPFAGPLLCAIAVGIVFFPMHNGLSRLTPRLNPSLQALLSDAVVLLFFVIPTGLLVWAVISEADRIIPEVNAWIPKVSSWFKSDPLHTSPWLAHLPAQLTRQLDVRSAQVQERLAGLANRSLSSLAHFGTVVAGNAFGFIIDTIIFLFTLFFVFKDGEGISERWTDLLPLDRVSKNQINSKLHMTIVGVVRGTLLTSLLQGVCSAVGFLIIRTEAAILLGVLTAMATLIPSIGTALVWIPVAVLYLLSGAYFKGIFVVVWGIVVVGVVDNLVRPYLVGNKADMPFFWLFFALLGGIEVFGLRGIIVGPLILGIIPVLTDIYRQHFLDSRAR